MGKSKMDDAAAARILKARGDKDDFARRAQNAARAHKDKKAESSSTEDTKGDGSGSSNGQSRASSGTK